MRFPKDNRLRKRREFQKVFQAQNKVVYPELVIYGSKRQTGQRLGLVVSKKVSKAVGRNLVKRRLRESFRLQKWSGAWDLVVIARPKAKEASLTRLSKILRHGIQRLDL